MASAPQGLYSEDLMEAIRKSLPAQTVGVLQQELAELERLRGVDQELKDTKEKLSKAQNDHRTASAEVDRRRAQEADLEKREKAVTDAEIRQEVTLLKTRLEESDKRSQIVQDLAKTVFRNSVVQETVFDKRTPEYSPTAGGPGIGGTVQVKVGEDRTRTEG